MKRFSDNGFGITRESLDFIGSFLKDHPTFKPLYACAKGPLGDFKLIIRGYLEGEQCKVRLSGCNCGYNGDGPAGTASVLLALLDRSTKVQDVEYTKQDLMRRLFVPIAQSEHIHFYFKEKPSDIQWVYPDSGEKGSLALSTLIDGKDGA